ncbi:hypothetical protein [uncultured Methanobrevibacter sp.]|uniref:hypothetical protein n=1 Tax=uncultured Methanobrevibacter sp. TaxID=253161 RepID=UPI0025876413|nr:hypothetical protein [uncultured Methanobrevibacter sp.]
MAKINPKILSYIKKTEYDEDIQDFLIKALLLEYKRDKTNYHRFFDDYDQLIGRSRRWE